jgi:hypothetical protein
MRCELDALAKSGKALGSRAFLQCLDVFLIIDFVVEKILS